MKMNKMMHRCFGVFAAVISAAMLMTGCGSTRNSYSSYQVSETMAAAASDSYNAKMASGAGYAMEEAAEYDYAGSSAISSGDSLAGNAGEVSQNVDTDASIERKLIRNVNVSLQTKEFDELKADITNQVKALGGYIESSGVYSNDYYGGNAKRYADITARVPSSRLDEFLGTALTKGTITSQNEYTEDISLKYSDLESKVNALEVERDRLMELLAQAESIESIIAIEERLSEIRYELESIKSSLRLYDNQVSYSTVYINISEVSVVETSHKNTFVERIKSGFEQNLLALGDAITDLIIGIITNLPAIILLLLVVFVCVKVFKGAAARFVKRSPLKKTGRKHGKETDQAQEAEKAPETAEPESDKTE